MSTSVPTRYPSGVTNAFPREVMGMFNYPNPFNSHIWADDFDFLGATGVKYTITAAGGSIAKSAGDGGTILFTTGAVAANFASMQLVNAGFGPSLGKRMWFSTRVNIEDVTAASISLGLIQTTVTPVTITDGIVFEKAAASTVWTLKHYVGSVATLSLTLPAAGFLPISGAAVDLGFYLTEKGYLYGFANTVALGGLYGYMPQSGDSMNRQALVGGQVPTLTAVNLNPTMNIAAGASGAELMTGDFLFAAKERI